MMNHKEFKKSLPVGDKSYAYYSIETLVEKGLANQKMLAVMPKSLKVLMENLLRHLDGKIVSKEDIEYLLKWDKKNKEPKEMAFAPARVLMQDFTGVPAVVDLATMRDAVVKLGGDPSVINPLSQVDLVIDHSVTVEKFGTPSAFKENVKIEFEQNHERYEFLRWGQKAFKNFRVVPPGTGICHQVNLEYIAQVVWTDQKNGEMVAYPDTLVGTDSHTTMVNGLSVLGWGVGGIEAEAAMLGQPISMLIPDVVGFKLKGKLKEGTTATDLVLTVTQMLRAKGVVGKFVEFFGPGLEQLPLADRATLANMAPEYGATCGFFPVDQETLNYLILTGREQERIDLVKAYAKAQGLWRDAGDPDPVFNDVLELDLSEVEASIAGPKRPQDKIFLKQAASLFKDHLGSQYNKKEAAEVERKVKVEGSDYELKNGDVVIAAITSCTNTSNPSVLIAAGLVARKARERGLNVKPWVKTSLAPGSQVVTDYLQKAGLQADLDAMGFNLVGYGCTTCIGNSGPLPEKISKAVHEGDLVVCSVLSGNRNFEGRVSPDARANYLASPPLVVAYALAGSMKIDLVKEPIGQDKNGRDVYLKDIWPSNHEIAEMVAKNLNSEMFRQRYSNVFKGGEEWQKIKVGEGLTYQWDEKSTFIKKAPYFDQMTKQAANDFAEIFKARPLLILGDSITTDHISPAGNISKKSPAAQYLRDRNVKEEDFNSYGARRGNHEVMVRGTFANIRIKNEMIPGVEGSFSKHIPSGEVTSVYDVAMKYVSEKTPTIVVAGQEYGTGSSRDWAGKGPNLLGIRAVIAESFERIHRSNLIGMGVLPLQFFSGMNRKTLKLTGTETFDLYGFKDNLQPGMKVKCRITRENGDQEEIDLLCRIDTFNEVEYFKNKGILQYVLRKLIN